VSFFCNDFYDCKGRDRRNIWQGKGGELENFAKNDGDYSKFIWQMMKFFGE
jgi:hypothetical protein